MTVPSPQVVVVTGSSSGIGQATAALYLAQGATVYGLDVADPQPEPERPDPSAGLWRAITTDVSDPASVGAAFDQVLASHAHVDVLVTSAGVGYPEPFLEITQESWDRVLGINVTGTMLCLQAALPSMRRRGEGSVVVISSIAGRTRSVANGAHYTASKYGLIGLTRHVAAELAGTGVRVNCVAPGPTNSPILLANSTPEEREQLVAKTPLRRIAEPVDVAEVVAFVAGPRARHIHGAVVDVNGGMY